MACLSEPSDVGAYSNRPAPGDLLLLGLWYGLAAGLLEVALWPGRGLGSGIGPEARLYGSQFGWMSPVANAIIFLGAALGMVVLDRLRVVRLSMAGACFVFAFLASFAPLVTFHPRFHKVASVVLALGVASVVARHVQSQPALMVRVVRLSGPALGAAVVAALAFGQINVRVTEARALRRLPPAEERAPNLLLITLDTVAAQHMSLYGYERPTTPRLAEFGRRGVVFHLALAPSSWTLPSHASLFTGYQPGEMSADWRTPYVDSYPTLAEVLSAHGYLTSGFVANTSYMSRAHGLDRGFAHYEDHPVSWGQLAASSALARFGLTGPFFRGTFGFRELLGRKTAIDLNASALRWVDQNPGRPFFMFLNYFDAHSPYVPPEPYASAFGASGDSGRSSPQSVADTPQEVSFDLASYDASLAFLDDSVGRLLDELESKGVLGNTLVVITSDHGEEFLEHGVMGHGASLYLKSLHVPLVMVFPGRLPEATRVEAPVSLSDVPATVADLVGLDERGRFPGRSMAPHWTTRSDQAAPAQPVLAQLSFAENLPPEYPVSKGDMVSVVHGKFHYIHRGDGVEELYDIDADKAERVNLAGGARPHPLLSELRRLARAQSQQMLSQRPSTHDGSGSNAPNR